jgi:serine protease Do
MKKMSFALAAIVVASLITGVILTLPQGVRSGIYAEQLDASAAARKNLTTAQDLSTAFRNVSEALRPSVVSISTKVRPRQGGLRLPPQLRGIPPWMLEDLFGDLDNLQERVPARTGMGSGVIVRADGYILTNNHVVENADEVEVELSDGRTVVADVVGTDPETDLAVLKIDATGLQPAPLGNSDQIEVGDWVLAIGSPFGLDQTVTAGIISGKNRVQGIVGDGRGFEDFLQTDAAINPGNSGGPLVNLRGELVGINTAILSRSGGNAGIGFAIPVALAEPVLNSIIETGEVRRGFLGAQVGDVNPDIVEKFGLKVDQGALISGVLEDQPADRAGLMPGDVVTQLDGTDVTSGTQLRNYIASRRPGATVTMEINRDGETRRVEVNLLERTDNAMAMFDSGGSLFGAELIPVTPETAEKYGYSGLDGGLIVVGVEDDSLAAQGDLRVGDVIEQAGGYRVRTVEQLTKIFNEAQSQGANLRVLVRRGNGRFMLVFEP